MNTEHVMTVGELRQILSELDGGLPIILAKDGEGNGYSPMAAGGVDPDSRYEEETDWSGQVYYPDWCDFEDDDEPCDHSGCCYGAATPVVVFGPVN